MSGAIWLALRGALAGAAICSLTCAGPRGQPDWIDGTSASYPKERYLIGVGQAGDLDAARDRARAEIARIFEVRIEDSVVDRTEGVTRTEGARSESSIVEHIAVETRTQTRGDLEGVEIADTWEDARARRVYALAVLDARRAHRRLLEQIAQREEDVAGFLDSARSAPGALAGARALVGAARASRERDRLAAWARVVGPAGSGPVERGPGTATLERRLVAALARVHFAVRARELSSPGSVERVDLPGLRDAISSRLTRMGFRAASAEPAAPHADAPELQIECRLTLGRIERGHSDWRHYRWEGACDVGDARGVLVSAADSGSESHPADATARTKARSQGEQILAEAVERDLQRYLYEAEPDRALRTEPRASGPRE